MRDYLSPARNYLGRAKTHSYLVSRSMLKPRFMALLASTVVVTIFAASVVALRVVAQNSSQQNETITETKTAPGTTSVTQTVTTQSDTPVVDAMSETTSSTTEANVKDAQSTTNVTVNNQPIEVPQNGSVHKVITSDNGTTQVDVTVNSSDSSTNVSTRSSSNYSVNTQTSSQSIIHSSP